MTRFLALALLVGTVAVPGHAAEGIDCIAEQLTAEQRTEIPALMLSGAQPPSWLIDSLGLCVRRHGWSEDAQRGVMNRTLGAVWRESLLVDPPLTPDEIARLDRAIASIPEAQQRSWYENTMTAEGQAMLDDALARAGVEQGDAARNAFIAYYLLTDHMVRFGEADFVAAP